jgi:hypothetical protein
VTRQQFSEEVFIDFGDDVSFAVAVAVVTGLLALACGLILVAWRGPLALLLLGMGAFFVLELVFRIKLGSLFILGFAWTALHQHSRLRPRPGPSPTITPSASPPSMSP